MSDNTHPSTIDNKVWISIFSFFLIASYVMYIFKNCALLPSHFGNATDCNVFVTMGFSWINGLIPYKDIFDHKGPLLYLIQAIGYLATDSTEGIFAILIHFALAWVLLLCVLFKEHPLYGIIAILLGLKYCFSKSFEWGNLTEDWSVLFSISAIFTYFKMHNLCKEWRFILYGICGAGAFLLRPNLAIVPFCIFVFDFFENMDISNKKQIVKLILWTGLGFMLLFAPFSIYFACTGAFKPFINSFLLYNIFY